MYTRSVPGKQYVIYSAEGGPLTLNLPPGRYRIIRFNPATGHRLDVGLQPGGQSTTIPLPADEGAVLLVSKKLFELAKNSFYGSPDVGNPDETLSR